MTPFAQPKDIAVAPAAVLPELPTLLHLQEYVRRIKLDRGHPDDERNAVVRLAEEVEELTAAVREAGPPTDAAAGSRRAVAYEVADVLIFLLDVANQFGIGVEEAFRAKERVNRARRYGAAPNSACEAS